MKQIPLLLVFVCFAKITNAQKPDSIQVVQTVDSLISVSRALTNESNFDAAIEVNKTAELLAQETLGALSPAYASTCFNHGRVMHAKGEYNEAEIWYLKSKDIRAQTLGTQDPSYASSLNNLGALEYENGDYNKAAYYYRKSMLIREKALGKESLEYAQSLNNLGLLYYLTGEYAQSEAYFLLALDIREKVLGKTNPQYATSLINLGALYAQKGDYGKAEPLFLQALNIRAEAFGEENAQYAIVLNHLANLHYEKGEFEKALEYALASSEIWRKTLGTEHPYYAAALCELADLYVDHGDYEKAETLYLHAIDIRSHSLPEDHPDYATSLNSLAKLYQLQGEFNKAETLYTKAIAIRKKSLGPNHIDYARSLDNIASLYQQTNRINEAAEYYLEATQINQQLVDAAAAYSSENEMQAFLQIFDASNARLTTFAQKYPNKELGKVCFNNALFYNGLLLENARKLARAIAEADSTTQAIYLDWQGCHRRLAKRYARPIADRKKIAEVEVEAESYEKMLMRNLPAFQETRSIPHWQEVRDQLQPEEAAIEFIHFRNYSPERKDSILYAALLLRSGWDAPKIIPLFEAREMDVFLQTDASRKADYVSNLYTIHERGIDAAHKVKKSLFDLIWRPLEKDLDSVRTLYFAPSGILHRLNLSAIPIPPSTIGVPDSILADRYHLIELGSTRQLTNRKFNAVYQNNAVLFGGIRYDMDSTAVVAAINDLDHQQDLVSRGASDLGLATDTPLVGQWPYLSGTAKEVTGVKSILQTNGFQTVLYMGYTATEEAFKQLGTDNVPSPRILHIATHGFFFPDPKDSTAYRQPLDEQAVGFKTSHNPLVRSGLLLAGANQAWVNGKPLVKGMENSILTAYEISHMNLTHTELVVLSACETGLGDIEGNEGVYGLQRAFKIAGAKYLIMSLWQVPDKQTSLLMTRFYQKWLDEKMDIPTAFREAQQEMRAMGFDPYQWAGFILVE